MGRLSLPPAETLRELFEYEPETGHLYWRNGHRVHGFKKHVRAGTVHCGKYRVVVVNGARFYEHRVIWKIMTGNEPAHVIDHADNNHMNNAWENLRAADNAKNRWNSALPKNNRSGIKGVCWEASHKSWKAYVSVNGRQIKLGRFKKIDDAAVAVAAARSRLHGEFARAA